MSHTIRIQDAAYQKLLELAQIEQLTLQTVLTRSIELYENQLFLEGLAQDFARYQSRKKDWVQEHQERTLWDRTLTDGEE